MAVADTLEQLPVTSAPYLDFKKIVNRGQREARYADGHKWAGQIRRYGEKVQFMRVFLGRVLGGGKLDIAVWAFDTPQVQRWMQRHELVGSGNLEKFRELPEILAIEQLISPVLRARRASDDVAGQKRAPGKRNSISKKETLADVEG